MEGMNSTMGSSMDAMGMNSYFSQWDSYQLHLLFSSWNIRTPWQFALTWFAVCLATIFYHCLECMTVCMRQGMTKFVNSLPPDGHVSKRPIGWISIKVIFGIGDIKCFFEVNIVDVFNFL